VLYGYLQEWLFSEPGYSFSLFVTLMQFVTFVCFAYLDTTYHDWKLGSSSTASTSSPSSSSTSSNSSTSSTSSLPAQQRRRANDLLADMRAPLPAKVILFMGLLLVVSFGMSNMSLLYLTYPTKVILKACKLIPVMVIGLSVQGLTYSVREYTSAVALVLGLALFTLGDRFWLLVFPVSIVDPAAAAALATAPVDPKATTWSLLAGLFLMAMSLVADSYLGNWQERTLRQYRCTPQQLVLYNSTVGACFLTLVTLISGELRSAAVYSVEHPASLARLFLLNFVGYLGVSTYLVLVKTSGIFVATIVATIRKFLTILLSFVLFPKPFTLAHAFGLVAVAAGITLNIQTKHQKHKVRH
jgi:adenosine 3'-phospho 5'-phosphosulfate transporter B3